MLRDIYLYGHLEQAFGRHHRFAVESVSEAVRALHVTHEDFFTLLRDGSYHIFRGELGGDDLIGIDRLDMRLGMAPIHIVPVVEGAKGDSKGILTAVVGFAMISTAVVLSGGTMAGLGATAVTLPGGLGTITYGNIALLGAVLGLGGIYQLVSPQVKVDNYDRDEQPTSYLFTGPANRTEGNCVPVLMGGPFEIGSYVVSSDIETVETGGSGSPVGGHTITVSFSANGTVSPGPGDVHVAHNAAMVSFKFYPSSLYMVTGVTVDGVALESFSEEGYSFLLVTDDHTLHVDFGLKGSDHVITCLSVGNGVVAPSGAQLVDDGADFTVELQPVLGYQLLYVDVDGIIVTSIDPDGGSYTFSSVSEDHNLTAYFGRNLL